MPRTPRNGSTEPSERTALLDNDATDPETENAAPAHAHAHAQHKDGSVWLHLPKLVVHLTWSTLVRDYVNLFLVFVPLGIIAGALEWDSTAVFALNFLAIIPLASLLSFATEELAATMGQALGGLMNATFGNAVELIVCSPIWTCARADWVGEHYRVEGWSDSRSPGEYAREYSFEHSSRSRLLLLCWWTAVF